MVTMVLPWRGAGQTLLSPSLVLALAYPLAVPPRRPSQPHPHSHGYPARVHTHKPFPLTEGVAAGVTASVAAGVAQGVAPGGAPAPNPSFVSSPARAERSALGALLLRLALLLLLPKAPVLLPKVPVLLPKAPPPAPSSGRAHTSTTPRRPSTCTPATPRLRASTRSCRARLRRRAAVAAAAAAAAAASARLPPPAPLLGLRGGSWFCCWC